MPDIQHSLEHRQRELVPEDGAFERLVRLRHRRTRNRRIRAGMVASAVAVGLVWAAATAWENAEPSQLPPMDRENVGDVQVAWTANVGEDPSPPVVDGGTVYVVADRLYAFPITCARAGIACPPSWTGAIHQGSGESIMPAVGDGVVAVSVSGGGLVVFPQGCGGDSCDPLWTATTSTTTSSPADVSGFSAPTIRDGEVYVGASDGLYVFDVSCRSDGGTCAPAWRGRGESGSDAPQVSGGRVFVVAHPSIRIYPARCDTDRCDPLSVWRSVSTYIPSVRLGAEHAVVGAFVYAEDCLPRCSPSWVARLDPATPNDVTSKEAQPAAITEGEVFITSNRVYAYPLECRDDGGECAPSWAGPRQFDEMVHQYEGWSAPVVVGDLVFAATDRAYAFPTSCDGDCEPLWIGPDDQGISLNGISADGTTVVTTSPLGVIRAFQVP